ncbi:hypothetical protein CNMCM5793_008900 [Aspergillus hiratsukae]|nr:hypothetical protein CNMCM5793_008900 [Aspergillus hiratsukae]
MGWGRPFAKEGCTERLKQVRESLYICNVDEAPDHFTEDVFNVCTLEVNLSAIRHDLFRNEKSSSGQEYYRVLFDIVMTPTSANILFHLEFNGASYGSVQVKY